MSSTVATGQPHDQRIDVLPDILSPKKDSLFVVLLKMLTGMLMVVMFMTSQATQAVISFTVDCEHLNPGDEHFVQPTGEPNVSSPNTLHAHTVTLQNISSHTRGTFKIDLHGQDQSINWNDVIDLRVTHGHSLEGGFFQVDQLGMNALTIQFYIEHSINHISVQYGLGCGQKLHDACCKPGQICMDVCSRWWRNHFEKLYCCCLGVIIVAGFVVSIWNGDEADDDLFDPCTSQHSTPLDHCPKITKHSEAIVNATRSVLGQIWARIT